MFRREKSRANGEKRLAEGSRTRGTVLFRTDASERMACKGAIRLFFLFEGILRAGGGSSEFSEDFLKRDFKSLDIPKNIAYNI